MSAKSDRKRLWTWFWAAVAGVVSAAVFLAVAELVALLVARDGSPILAVGSFVIDIVPQPFKEFAIATFGENDKIALLVGLALGVVVAAAVTGVLQYLRPPLGVVALGRRRRRSRSPRSSRVPERHRSHRCRRSPGRSSDASCLVLLVRRLRAWRAAVGDAGRGRAPAGRRPPSARPCTRRARARGRPSIGARSSAITAIAGASAIIVGVGARAS